MELEQFLKNFGIDSKSLSDIKKRVYIVGKFNTSKHGVSEFIFSKNATPDERLRDENGEMRVGNLSYSSFIKKIEPKLSELFSQEQTYKGEPLPYFILSPHSANQKVSSSYIIDNYNYFDVRASSNSEQPFYKNQSPNVNIKDFLDASRFSGKNELPGKEIYKQIKENLNSFCSFQSRNFELIQAFSILLSKFAGTNGVPAGITAHSEMPVNFLPVFIDFLYLEKPIDETFKQKLELIDFNSHVVYKAAITDGNRDRFLEFLVTLFSVFKDYLNNPKSVEEIALPGHNIRIELNPEKGIISEDLRQKFIAALEAYNMLTQIIQSKVLLSMVLRWAISFFENEIPEIKNIADAGEKNEAIEDAIIKGKHGLAAPAEGLPEGYSTTDLINDFVLDFPLLLTYINDPSNETNIQNFKQFNGIIQAIGEAILQDEQKRITIQRMMAMPKEQREAMFKALLNLFIDVLIPKLFKAPGLTEEDLIKKFKEYEMELFFTSAMMDITSTGSIDSIIEDEMGNVNGETREAIVGKLINVFVGVLMAPDVQQKIEQTVNTLQDYQLLRRLTPGITNPDQKNLLGIGEITARISPAPKLKPGETAINTGNTKERLQKLDIENIGKRKDINTYLPAPENEASNSPAALTDSSAHRLRELKAGKEIGSSISEKGAVASEGNNNSTSAVVAKGTVSLAKTLSPIEIGDKILKNNLGTAIQKYLNSDDDNKLVNKTEVEKIIADGTIIYQKSLSKIFERYAGSLHLPAFKSKVEALTLTWLLLLNKEKLHLGELGSNLYDLLLDLIEKLNAQTPDLKTFFSQNSLTKYISKGIFSEEGYEGAGSGFKALATVLDNQAKVSLGNVVQFVSELKGVRYLIDFAGTYAPDCEIIVINAYAHEFIQWMEADHSYGNFLNPTGLANNNLLRPKFPIAVFMTDLAFANDGWDFVQSQKDSFLLSLSKTSLLNQGGRTRLIPPICISTSGVDPKNTELWKTQGEKMNRLAKDAICPVLIIGPSLPLNRQDDYLFPTVLSSGYVFCAHLLTNGAVQNLRLSGISSNPSERFRNLGLGVAELHVAIKHFISASGERDKDYAFAGDYYLYLIALIASASKNSNIGSVNWDEFYSYFYFDGFSGQNYDSSSFINEAMIYNKMTDWSFSESLFNKLLGKVIPIEENENGDIPQPSKTFLTTEILLRDKKERPRPLNLATWFEKVVDTHKLK
jgi:hypothetical protein